MQVRFLLGPAGSGKTFRCLDEVRSALKESPEGPPLIFLAPKQATFQIERQLLSDDSLNGFTRLQILSFERLAQFVFEKLKVAPPQLLSDEGRVMVLRALLLRHEKELKLFRQSARRPGFAQQLSQLLREMQQHQFTPGKLRVMAAGKEVREELRDKLVDLALILEKYTHWLEENSLQDANRLLDLATDALRSASPAAQPALAISGLWLDGFAEMTPQEMDLLAAVMPFCDEATLAFCLDPDAYAADSSWLSIWNCVGVTFQKCRQRLEELPGCKVEVQTLQRHSTKSRFARNDDLARLERQWVRPADNARPLQDKNSIRIVECADVEAEAVFAAREILRFVRAGNRFRDCAVIVRDLERCHKSLVRIFSRYQIPFFLDRRESIAHHPLAELTRGALRTVAFDWQHDDLFAALKTGFGTVEETEIDRLENAALEFGWRGKKWREPLPDEAFEQMRKKIFPPFETLFKGLADLDFAPNGEQLTKLLRRFWNDLRIEQRLEEWAHKESDGSPNQRLNDSTHSAVLTQMDSLLDNLALGFAREKLLLRDWLPILEAGLANLTVGVIPPVLDEVLIGAIDRARNPDLKLALVLGLNETVFPASPDSPAILTHTDRDDLRMSFGMDLHGQLSRERFYGYLACTRASERLITALARNDAGGAVLNPSPFISHLKGIFADLLVEKFQDEAVLIEVENAAEVAPLLFANPDLMLQIAGALAGAAITVTPLREPDPQENLSAIVAERLYGPVLRTSVSRLEEFAACPFRFFVRSGLRAEERKLFELDGRERGSFQHDVLKCFHDGIIAEGKRWRDLTPEEARARIARIAAGLTSEFRSGLLNETAQSRFAAQTLTESLQDFVAVSIVWLREQNQFDPAKSELDFGDEESLQAALEIDLEKGRKLALKGRIDRVDLCCDKGQAAAIVIDYKSSQKKLDPILVEHGVQLQLLAYLNVLRQWKNPREAFGVDKLIPAGVFYVNLRGRFENGSRDEVLANAGDSLRAAYRHTGRFDAGILKKLDGKCACDQFNYRLTKEGKLYANSIEALPREAFEQLLDDVETQLRNFGNAIFSGRANVDPYRKGKQTPCGFCDYAAACRIDPWTHSFRVLRPAKDEVIED